MQFSKVLVALMGSTIVSCYDAVFTVYPGSNCGSGGTVISAYVGNKGDFNPDQGSVKVSSISSGNHLSLYSGHAQSGTITRFTGSSGCVNGAFDSYGVYSG